MNELLQGTGKFLIGWIVFASIAFGAFLVVMDKQCRDLKDLTQTILEETDFVRLCRMDMVRLMSSGKSMDEAWHEALAIHFGQSYMLACYLLRTEGKPIPRIDKPFASSTLCSSLRDSVGY